VHMSMVLLRSKVEGDQDELLRDGAVHPMMQDAAASFLDLSTVGVDPRPEEVIDDALPAYAELRRRITVSSRFLPLAGRRPEGET